MERQRREEEALKAKEGVVEVGNDGAFDLDTLPSVSPPSHPPTTIRRTYIKR
jgi:hypothetical protein